MIWWRKYDDEFSLGYERLIGWSVKAGIHGVYRTLREAIDDAYIPGDIDQRKYFSDENGDPVVSNPTYGQVYRYQPSFSLRLGFEVEF